MCIRDSGKQWLRIKGDAELLDTPGILPPKFEDQTVAVKLAYTGAIKDEIMNTELLAYSLCDYLRDNYPNELCTRYKLDTVEMCIRDRVLPTLLTENLLQANLVLMQLQ